jgi:deoxyribodipyrimidine photo-lyase
MVNAKSIFLFRRDYRLYDNTALNWCISNSSAIYLLFVFTPEQIHNNDYKSDNAVQFLVESLKDLNDEVRGKITFCYGDILEVLQDVIEKNPHISNLVVNNDYTPYSKKRDSLISALMKKMDVRMKTFDDLLLYPLNSVLTRKGTLYSKFGPYYKEARKITPLVPKTTRLKLDTCGILKSRYALKSMRDMDSYYQYNPNIAVRGGRKRGTRVLNRVCTQKQYNTERDLVFKKTTMLSAYIRFGVLSIRECYSKINKRLGPESKLLDQLFWNCFYTELGNNFPDMFSKRYMLPRFRNVRWETSSVRLDAWKSGKTGFPLSDAGMRELNATGFMHNRVRMVSATLLSRVLLIDWRLGERYFSTKLVDHQRSNNDGNWMWVVGTANHSQPYFRIMSEWRQIKKYDPDCIYIKKWIPELQKVPVEEIINWRKFSHTRKVNYPSPIVDDDKQKKKSLLLYRKT